MAHNAPTNHAWFVPRRVRRADFRTHLRNQRRLYRPSPRGVLLRLLIPALVVIAGLLVGSLFLDRLDMRPGWRGAGLALAAVMVGMGTMALYALTLVTLFPRAVRRVLMSNQRDLRGLRREHRRGLPPMWATGMAMLVLQDILVATSLLAALALLPPRDEQVVYILAVLFLLVVPLITLIRQKWTPFRRLRRAVLRMLRVSPPDRRPSI